MHAIKMFTFTHLNTISYQYNLNVYHYSLNENTKLYQRSKHIFLNQFISTGMHLGDNALCIEKTRFLSLSTDR